VVQDPWRHLHHLFLLDVWESPTLWREERVSLHPPRDPERRYLPRGSWSGWGPKAVSVSSPSTPNCSRLGLNPHATKKRIPHDGGSSFRFGWVGWGWRRIHANPFRGAPHALRARGRGAPRPRIHRRHPVRFFFRCPILALRMRGSVPTKGNRKRSDKMTRGKKFKSQVRALAQEEGIPYTEAHAKLEGEARDLAPVREEEFRADPRVFLPQPLQKFDVGWWVNELLSTTKSRHRYPVWNKEKAAELLEQEKEAVKSTLTRMLQTNPPWVESEVLGLYDRVSEILNSKEVTSTRVQKLKLQEVLERAKGDPTTRDVWFDDTRVALDPELFNVVWDRELPNMWETAPDVSSEYPSMVGKRHDTPLTTTEEIPAEVRSFFEHHNQELKKVVAENARLQALLNLKDTPITQDPAMATFLRPHEVEQKVAELLHEAICEVLGDNVQRGFFYNRDQVQAESAFGLKTKHTSYHYKDPTKLTSEQVEQVEELVNSMVLNPARGAASVGLVKILSSHSQCPNHMLDVIWGVRAFEWTQKVDKICREMGGQVGGQAHDLVDRIRSNKKLLEAKDQRIAELEAKLAASA